MMENSKDSMPSWFYLFSGFVVALLLFDPPQEKVMPIIVCAVVVIIYKLFK